MARIPRKPWFWTQTGEWCVTIEGQRHRLGPDEKEATTKFHELMSRPSSRVRADSVKAVVDLFLDWTEKHRSPLTYAWYKQHLQSFLDSLSPPLLTVDRLKAHHVTSWLDSHDWGASYQRGAMTAVSRCLRWAAKNDRITVNPLYGKLEKPTAKKRDFVVSAKAYKELLALISGEFRALVETCYETGCRPSEIVRVEAYQVETKNGRWVFKEELSKGKKRKRIVYLSPKALATTKRLMKLHPEGPIFRLPNGERWNRHDVSQYFQRLKKKLGVQYRLYDFRHTFITNGLINGVDPVTMANLVGHVDLKMIHAIYSHVSQNTAFMRDAAKKAIGHA